MLLTTGRIMNNLRESSNTDRGDSISCSRMKREEHIE